MRANLIIDQNGMIYGAGKTKEECVKDLNQYLSRCENDDVFSENDFDIYGNLINPDGSPQSSSESEWRLIDASVSENDILKIYADSEYTLWKI